MTAEIVYEGAGTTANEKLKTTTTWNADGAQHEVATYVGGSTSAADILTFAYYAEAGRPEQVLRGATVLTAYAWDHDGTLLSRDDGPAGAVGLSTYEYDWANRLTKASLPAAWASSGSASYTYRLDGLLVSRGFPGAATGLAFAYDSAKRPTAITQRTGETLTFSLGQTYDAAGNVTTESRSFPTTTPPMGIAGSGSQTFDYDALDRLTHSRDLGTAYNRTYAYDLDSNRVERRTGPPESEIAYTTTFDRTDIAIATSKDGGTAVASSYDRYGNLLTDGSGGVADEVVAYAYDLADRTIAITPQGATDPTELSLDALGRVATRTTGEH